MAEHNTLTGSAIHECKLISTASTGDAGKVITPHSSVAGTSTLRKLVESEIQSKVAYLTFHLPLVDTVADFYFVAPFAGTVEKIYTVIDDAFTGSDNIIQMKIDSVSVTTGAVTITQSGSAAGDVDTVTPTSNKTFNEGSVLQFTSDVGASSALNVSVSIIANRS